MVHVEDYGSRIVKEGKRIVIKKGRTAYKELPVTKIEILYIGKGVLISSDVLTELCEQGITVFFRSNKTIITNSSHLATPEVRLAQYALSEQHKFTIGKEIIGSKITNQKATSNRLEKELNIEYSPENLDDVLKLEAQIAKRYWKNIREAIPNYSFRGRVPRGGDLVNSCFDYGYGILKNLVFNAVLNASLDPYLGILHKTKDYRASLVFDIMEIFRPFVDYSIVRFLNTTEYEEFIEAKYALAKEVTKELSETHKYKGKNESLKRIMLLQCYELANFIRYKDKLDMFRVGQCT